MTQRPDPEDRRRLLRALVATDDVGNRTEIDADERAADADEVMARLRTTIAEQVASPSTAAATPTRPAPAVGAPWVVAALVAAVALGVWPRSVVLLVLVFGVLPVALLARWSVEAYTGPELDRECEIVLTRAGALRRLRRVLADLGDELAGERGADDLVGRFRAASEQAGAIGRRLTRTARAMREFAVTWYADPVAACRRYERAADHFERVRTDLDTLVSDLQTLAADAGLSRVEGDLDARAARIAGSLGAARTAIREELTRLERAFDPIHAFAVSRAIRTATPSRLVRLSAIVAVSTNSRRVAQVDRPRVRSTFLREARIADSSSMRTVRDAGVAMRRAV